MLISFISSVYWKASGSSKKVELDESSSTDSKSSVERVSFGGIDGATGSVVVVDEKIPFRFIGIQRNFSVFPIIQIDQVEF